MDTNVVHSAKSNPQLFLIYFWETAFILYVITGMVGKTNSNLKAITSIQIKL